MTMYATRNGNGAAESHLEYEAAFYSNPEFEYEWEGETDQFSSPQYEYEWQGETDPYSGPSGEYEFETDGYTNGYYEGEAESDQFLPFLIPLAAKALPLLKKVALPAIKGLAKSGIKKLVPKAKQLAGRVFNNIASPNRPRPGGSAGRRPVARPATPARPGMPGRAGSLPGMPGGSGPIPGIPGMPGIPGGSGPRFTPSPARRQTIASLLRQLSQAFGEGETEASQLEANLFGANEAEGEIAAHEAAHEAALTEVMAAEAAHAETEAEAEAMLGAALPITIRIMGASQPLRSVMPTLIEGNARLVQTLHRDGKAGRQLLRLTPTIQRRTVASLQSARRAGVPITPQLARTALAGQAARVLSNPPVVGRSLARNVAIRQATVRPSRG